RYCAKIVKNVKIEPSPAWLRNRLRACGVRSINNIVDITNYVMLEYGQPMHAFDMRFLEDNKIVVKRAKDGEKFITLDGQERILTNEMLTICDGKKAVAVAGVMGGENSEIKEDTVDILFEGANFNYSSIRKTSKTLGLRTESSSRFDKGLDPETTSLAVQRACELVKLLNAGDVVEGMIDVNFTSGKKRELPFEPEKMNAFLGLDVSKEYMIDILERLEFEVKGDTLLVPTFRDEIQRMADVAEEIGRFYGYDKLPATVMCGTVIPFAKTKEEKTDAEIKKVLSENGYYEALTYTFMSPSEFDRICLPEGDALRDAVKISNPLGEDTSIMRTTILPAMLTSLGLNYSKRNPVVRLFEVGKVFLKSGEKLPYEPKKVVMGAYGDCDFYSVKGDVDVLLDALFIEDITYEPCTENPSFHPGRCAIIFAGGNEIGMIGEVHPKVLGNYEIETKAYVAVLDFKALVACRNANVTYKKLPKFPAVSRDLAVLCEDSVPVGHMQATIKKFGGKILEDVQLFDIYKGQQIPENKKSVAFALSFRASDRTLTDEEVNKAFNKIVERLNAEHGAELRL
ncbi:MAG: phenylalanine--tRNA ligase subunit beta, partial [Clostridia bacterium]|nr:phenylalanine--tRNA ligase subunit beta [Clostridia bacterium]